MGLRGSFPSLVIDGNSIFEIVLFLGLYKFYSRGAKGWSCLFSEMGTGGLLVKKLIHPLHISVFGEGVVMVENVIRSCCFVISCQFRSSSFRLSLSLLFLFIYLCLLIMGFCFGLGSESEQFILEAGFHDLHEDAF